MIILYWSVIVIVLRSCLWTLLR